ncbi:unnamed protein product, partial [Iphiclides podalirius]
MRSGDPINAPSDCARHPRPTPRPATQFATEKTPLVPRRVTPCALGNFNTQHPTPNAHRALFASPRY